MTPTLADTPPVPTSSRALPTGTRPQPVTRHDPRAVEAQITARTWLREEREFKRARKKHAPLLHFLSAARDMHWRDWDYAWALFCDGDATLDLAEFVIQRRSLRQHLKGPVSLRYAAEVGSALHAHGRFYFDTSGTMPMARSGQDLSCIHDDGAPFLPQHLAELSNAGWQVEDMYDARALLRLSISETRALFEAVPALSVEGLRGLVGADWPDRPHGPAGVTSLLHRVYATHGQRATHYLALGFTEEDMAEATRAGTPVDLLRTMVALAR